MKFSKIRSVSPARALAWATRSSSSSVRVGGFCSDHPGGANFAFGDGSIRYISDTISMQVFQQLGHRADGQLLDEAY